jgi:hypothetical protein
MDLRLRRLLSAAVQSAIRTAPAAPAVIARTTAIPIRSTPAARSTPLRYFRDRRFAIERSNRYLGFGGSRYQQRRCAENKAVFPAKAHVPISDLVEVALGTINPALRWLFQSDRLSAGRLLGLGGRACAELGPGWKPVFRNAQCANNKLKRNKIISLQCVRAMQKSTVSARADFILESGNSANASRAIAP